MTSIPEQALHDHVMTFGKHRGERLVRVPVGYLFWLVNIGSDFAAMARAEIDRRGATLPTIEVSHHAIDRASLMLRRTWHSEREVDGPYKGLGIASWLVRRAEAALRLGKPVEGKPGVLVHEGIRFIFDLEQRWPVLKTCRPLRRKPE